MTGALLAAAMNIMMAANTYGWGLSLQLDQAREGEAQLAIMQERYRFAADLHDIQGHTLHVLGLTVRLAERTVRTDPDAAAEHLRTAQELIGETLAQTRTLATGDRVVTMEAESANAQAIAEAAGITWIVTGEVAGDELLAVLLREATTNLLRHAQATAVEVTFGPGRVRVSNDGAPDTGGPQGGLARLAERFAARGGTLTTRRGDGRFEVEGVLP